MRDQFQLSEFKDDLGEAGVEVSEDAPSWSRRSKAFFLALSLSSVGWKLFTPLVFCGGQKFQSFPFNAKICEALHHPHAYNNHPKGISPISCTLLYDWFTCYVENSFNLSPFSHSIHNIYGVLLIIRNRTKVIITGLMRLFICRLNVSHGLRVPEERRKNSTNVLP